MIFSHPKLFLADMDSTMIGQECIDELADYAGVKTQISEITERAMQGELDFESALRARVSLLEGLSESALEQCYLERISINEGAKELLLGLKAKGTFCVLVSGGFTFFASKIAASLGFDDYHANEFEIVGGKLTGRVKGDIVGAKTKLQVLESEAERMKINLSETMAIGDGANDLDMIKAAGTGVAYNAKPILRDAADLSLENQSLDALLKHVSS